MGAVLVDKDDQYVLNHCTRFLARDSTDSRHNFGQYEPDDPRAVVCEAWRFPVVDSHYDGVSAESSYAYNDVTFVYDGRVSRPESVEVVGSFGDLFAPVPLRSVRFIGQDTGLHTVTLRVPKAQVHTYKFAVDGRYQLDPVNPQRSVADNGQPWSRFFTDACQVPLVLSRREREVLARLVTHLLPFRLAENRQSIQEEYDKLDRAGRGEEFPLAYRLDEEVGTVNYIDKVLARPEQHNADDYRTCLAIVDGLLRARTGGKDPLQLPIEDYAQLYAEMATDQVEGWDTSRYSSPLNFLLLLRRHAMTGAFVHPKAGGNSGAAGWSYLEGRFTDGQGQTLFDWRRALEAPLGHNTDYRG
ncbi:MAG TPA: gluconate 2-dehydrogenase subunit 3 family protein [Pseudonocardiaceae bacterium]|nr:gluconate 2-dehydrogenase subunit 3 family protein [Pseudonocardiaceae bacterium]